MSKSAPKPSQEEQLELALSSVLPHAIFQGRSTLLVREVATALECSEDQVERLINLGELVAINISGSGQPARRRCLRIPVSSYDQFVKKRAAATL